MDSTAQSGFWAMDDEPETTEDREVQALRARQAQSRATYRARYGHDPVAVVDLETYRADGSDDDPELAD